jgi:sRNA-binding regulator protein Hfq
VYKLPLRENIIDSRLNGREIKIKVAGYESEIKGIIDEVARYEIGLRSEGKAIVVFRHSIMYATINAADLHGYSGERLNDTVINSDLIGTDLELHLINGEKLEGRLMKISKYELGLRCNDSGVVVPKSAIAFAVITSNRGSDEE